MSFWTLFEDECRKLNKRPHTVAVEIGLPASSLTHLKHGRNPNVSVLIKVADYFGVSTDYLLEHSSPDGDMVLYELSGIEETGIKMFLALSRESKMQTMAYMEGLGDRNPDSDYEAFLKEREEYFRENTLPYAAKGGKNLEDVADIAQRYSDICHNNNSDDTE